MRRVKIPAIFLFLLIASLCQAQSFWKIKTDSGEEILLRIEVNNTTKTFTASTRKDAIKDIAGFFAYNLAHAAGKLKYPEIVHIEGKANKEKDSLKLDGVFFYTDKKYDFQASVSGNNFLGKYTDNKMRVHRLVGFKQPDGRPIQNYAAILDQVVAFSEKYFPNPEWPKTSEWNDFKEAVSELKSKISDDYELGALVMWYSRKFPFAPFDINKLRTDNLKQMKSRPQLQIPKPHVGVLIAGQLPWNQKQMDSLAVIISKQSITKLIIDLRERTTVTAVQAKLVMEHLSKSDFCGGALLGRKWYNLHSTFIANRLNETEFKNLPEVSDGYKFQEIEGFRLDIKRAKQCFSGEVFVLTDSRTSQMAEAISYILQHEKLAKVIGQKSAGRPFIVEKIKVTEEFELKIPVAIFMSPNGSYLPKTGINPDILVEKENSLNYLLKIL